MELKVAKREKIGNLDSLRKEGLMPAVFYGKKEDSTPIAIIQTDFIKVWKKAGESTVITLKSADGKSLDALIQEVDFDPVTDMPRHADFYVFDKDHKLEVDIPLEFIGVSPGVKEQGGLLVKVMHELKIEAMPKDLPHQIDVDISVLSEIGSQILAKDLKLPTGVSLIENPEEVVALISEAKEEEEEESVPVDLSSIEVEKKGKEAKEGEGEAPAEGEEEEK